MRSKQTRENRNPGFIVLWGCFMTQREMARQGIISPEMKIVAAQEKLDVELKEMHDSELWQAGAMVRSLRPENWNK